MTKRRPDDGVAYLGPGPRDLGRDVESEMSEGRGKGEQSEICVSFGERRCITQRARHGRDLNLVQGTPLGNILVGDCSSPKCRESCMAYRREVRNGFEKQTESNMESFLP